MLRLIPPARKALWTPLEAAKRQKVFSHYIEPLQEEALQRARLCHRGLLECARCLKKHGKDLKRFFTHIVPLD
ncbi:hypothetical protein D0864_04727 [Hortaea werneckii]|uniref:Uncharacterized protein n=1 Tax=Hortaea werneckii TaxID=91943 RepID=A0A3M7G8V5_HORWE|nr:hypothetical protein D0864_04727 [Hortaea werneckii]